MIQYSHTDKIIQKMIEYARVPTEDDLVFIYLRLQKIIQLRAMMKMNDDVPKLPMTYRDSPISCTQC